jgi:heat shock protein HslJ
VAQFAALQARKRAVCATKIYRLLDRYDEGLIMQKRMHLAAVFRILVLLVALNLLLSACVAQDSGADAGFLPGASLGNTFWTMTSMAGSEPLTGAEITAGFVDGQISGFTGCNNYFADYDTDGDRLILSNGGVTEMFCMQPDGIMDVERQFLDYFYQVDRFQLTSEALRLITGGGESLIFVPRES